MIVPVPSDRRDTDLRWQWHGAFIGFGPTPLYGNGNNYDSDSRAKHHGSPISSCSIATLIIRPAGDIDIWWVTVSDGLTITSVKTGTANILSIFNQSPNLYIAQADYDIAHDAIILQLTNSPVPTVHQIYVISVNFDGTLNWNNGQFDVVLGIPLVRDNHRG